MLIKMQVKLRFMHIVTYSLDFQLKPQNLPFINFSDTIRNLLTSFFGFLNKYQNYFLLLVIRKSFACNSGCIYRKKSVSYINS